MENHTFVCAVLGLSDSGKSYLSRMLMQRVPGDTYILNKRDSDNSWNENVKNEEDRKFKSISWETLGDPAFCVEASLVVEDCISLSDSQLKILRENICYRAHRKLNPQLMIFHSLTYSSLRRYLPLIHGIIISANMTSLPSLKAIIRYFETTPKEQEIIVNKFLSEAGNNYKFLYWCNA